jgi:carbon storage regulator
MVCEEDPAANAERKTAMLVLTRKSGEEIVVGKDIHVRVLRVASGRVHLGISAPHDVTVRRQEVVRTIENRAGPTRV